ncbi:unnamed protein product [Macrosiphum euphorbiae]|uniref:Uncharacterized protein n=1 Tax=Macrosiphum euphorbiae TaxID=13131 RepID=A0AAV0W5P9_9HEMI|nr:unnamed protein product [Macrosiphum euphorbiae]
MRTDVTCAINFRKLEDKPLNEKIAGLRFDINNAPNHRIFENHAKCSEYFCKKSGVVQNISLFKLLTNLIQSAVEKKNTIKEKIKIV